MAFVKAIKTKAYFKRYQTKYRRRREGKTDYAQRRMLVKQDKNKYNTAKYRLVVRTTNTKVICQIIYATIQGDRVVAAAESTELPRYGIVAGLKNYAAAYATGLLVARRLLKNLGLETAFVGKKEATGEEYHVVEDFEGERRPFRCVLDVGLARTTVGARLFGALKGAADGGLDIPYSVKRFPGFTGGDKDNKDGQYDTNVHKDRIMGKHVAEYMKAMAEDDKEAYQAHFAEYLKHGITADKVEAMYKKAHAAIRAKPEFVKKATKDVKNERVGKTIKTAKGNSYVRPKKLNGKQRKARVMEKIRVAQQRIADEQADE
jgi:large subunit ribosomal protein L5e